MSSLEINHVKELKLVFIVPNVSEIKIEHPWYG